MTELHQALLAGAPGLAAARSFPSSGRPRERCRASGCVDHAERRRVGCSMASGVAEIWEVRVVDGSWRVVVPTEVLVRRLPTDELMLLDMRSEQYFGLNASAARMWEALTSAERIDDAVAVLEGTYTVPPQALRADVEELIDELMQRNLLELHG